MSAAAITPEVPMLMVERPQSFVHTPRPALIGTTHPNQRYFSFGNHHRYEVRSRYTPAELYVLRFANGDHASLNVRLSGFGSIDIEMTPFELQELARALIDAAHDLETVAAVAELGSPS